MSEPIPAPRLLHDSINPLVFDRFPGYRWGKVVVLGIDNQRTPPEVAQHQRQAEQALRDTFSGEVVAHPAIAAWRAAFTAFGARPSKFQASIEALARRVRRGDELPTINGLVDLYNAHSVQFLLPVGGDDLATIHGALTLRFARGDEDYVPLGEQHLDPPEAGEVIYADDATVLCRRWCWRQGDRTRIAPTTTEAILNIHGLPPTTHEQVVATCESLARLVPALFGGVAHWYLLDREHPTEVTDLDALRATAD